MTPTGQALLAILAAYLIGSIPFAYLIVRVAKGIDIRTVGSGNVGATNAGRVLGSKGFLLVFVLDLLKGWLPTLGLPALVKLLSGSPVENLAVLVAVAAILGHNFPIYLNFRGGKGVSTSLGAALGLDWVAALSAAAVFLLTIKASRFVSLSSILGASAFLVVHVLKVHGLDGGRVWDREHLPFSVLVLGLYVMLLVRHRNNWKRILDGTEPKVGRRPPPSGRVLPGVLAAVACLGLATAAVVHISRPASLDCGAFTLVDLGRVKTGHQRAINPEFADKGRTLAVLCPRYDRLMIYRVNDRPALELAHDVSLDGQPMAIRASGDRFALLARPSGDERHVRPGYVELIGLDGGRLGPRTEIGLYPVDLALIDSGKTALVLTLGRTEGDASLPPPALTVVDLEAGLVVSRVEFEKPGDAPRRISVSANEEAVAVSLGGTDEVAAIDLSDRSRLRVIGRSPLPSRARPYPSISGTDWILMPVAANPEAAVFAASPGAPPLLEFLVTASPDDPAIEIGKIADAEPIGRLAPRGSGNLGEIRPTGLACSAEQGLIAVTSRSGGVHLVAARNKVAAVADPSGSSITR